MFRKGILFATAAAAALAVAGPAMAVSSSGGSVDVNITVTPIVSMWSNDASINLVIDGSDPGANGLALANSSLGMVTNVDARVDATVTGTLPAPIVPGGGINFFIFSNMAEQDIRDAIAADAYTAGGSAPVWQKADVETPGGVTKTVIPSTGLVASTNLPASTKPITYAVDVPGEVPLPDSYDLVVTYTITDATP